MYVISTGSPVYSLLRVSGAFLVFMFSAQSISNKSETINSCSIASAVFCQEQTIGKSNAHSGISLGLMMDGQLRLPKSARNNMRGAKHRELVARHMQLDQPRPIGL